MGGRKISSYIWEFIFSAISANKMAYVLNPNNYIFWDDIKFILSVFTALGGVIYWSISIYWKIKDRPIEKKNKELENENLNNQKKRHNLNGEIKNLLDNDL